MVWSISPAPVLLWLYNFYCVGFLRIGDIKFIFRALHGGYLRPLPGQWRGDETPGHGDTFHQNTGSGKKYSWQHKSLLLRMDEWSLFISDSSSLSRHLLSLAYNVLSDAGSIYRLLRRGLIVFPLSPRWPGLTTHACPRKWKLDISHSFIPGKDQSSPDSTLHSLLLFYTYNFATLLFIWL